jgi:ribonucleoside-diphosphate reductase beta chain
MNALKDIDNVVQATLKEEVVHALLGVYILKEVKKEFPDWFNEEFYNKLYRACNKAFEAECNIIDWIFEAGELSFLPKDVVKEFVKNRFNESLEMIDGEKVFEIDHEKLAQLKWFNDEIYAEVNTDFFHKKPVTYSKKVKSIRAEDLF